MEQTNDRQVYDLREGDMIAFPVWYFPMDETVADEATVRPIPDIGFLELVGDVQLIVRTNFTCPSGDSFCGYSYWGFPESVDYLRPTMFVGGGRVDFWSGVIAPEPEEISWIRQRLPAKYWPINFTSELHFGFKRISGSLEGIYFLDSNDRVTVIRP